MLKNKNDCGGIKGEENPRGAGLTVIKYKPFLVMYLFADYINLMLNLIKITIAVDVCAEHHK